MSCWWKAFAAAVATTSVDAKVNVWLIADSSLTLNRALLTSDVPFENDGEGMFFPVIFNQKL